MHGSLGSLVGSGDLVRTYRHSFHDKWLSGVGELIQVVSEAGSDSEAYRTARAMLEEAAHVVFLGFGYHEQNMKRLGLAIHNMEFDKGFSGSSHGFTQRERAQLQQRWKVSLGTEGWTTLAYLREEVTLG